MIKPIIPTLDEMLFTVVNTYNSTHLMLNSGGAVPRAYTLDTGAKEMPEYSSLDLDMEALLGLAFQSMVDAPDDILNSFLNKKSMQLSFSYLVKDLLESGKTSRFHITFYNSDESNNLVFIVHSSVKPLIVNRHRNV